MVYRGLYMKHTECAIKMCTSENISSLYKEAYILEKASRHPNIVGFYGFCREPGHEALVNLNFFKFFIFKLLFFFLIQLIKKKELISSLNLWKLLRLETVCVREVL